MLSFKKANNFHIGKLGSKDFPANYKKKISLQAIIFIIILNENLIRLTFRRYNLSIHFKKGFKKINAVGFTNFIRLKEGEGVIHKNILCTIHF